MLAVLHAARAPVPHARPDLAADFAAGELGGVDVDLSVSGADGVHQFVELARLKPLRDGRDGDRQHRNGADTES